MDKVVPYNISTIEHLLTKKSLIEVADKGIQADGSIIKAVEYYNEQNGFFLTEKSNKDSEVRG